jgi:hypothetical protein
VFKPGLATIVPVVFAIYIPTCAAKIRPTMAPKDVQMAELWEAPPDLAARDLYAGTWGKALAPDPAADYRFVARKDTGTNPGVTALDPAGREWHIKQPPHNDEGAEGPIEVALSRVLGAVGYHQPPVYFVPSFTLTAGWVARTEPGGRFRLDDKATLKKVGDWSWQQNPFVGTKPFQGLLVILMIFNSSDIKNDNNTLYALQKPAAADAQRWYVVRDLGTALGETGRIAPKRGDPDIFDKQPFITGVHDGFVRFAYHGWHQELVKHRITLADVKWACTLLNGLSDRQWADAFRAGGYEPQLAQRFITRVHAKIRQGLELDAPASVQAR